MERGGSSGGWGRGAASRIPVASSGGGGVPQTWQPGNYYPPGINAQSGDANGPGGLSNAGDILWGILQQFDRAGKVTAVSTTLSNPTGGAGKATMALYAYQSATPLQPGALLYSLQCTGQGFGGVYTDTSLQIPVAAGGALWFVMHGTLAGVDIFSGGVPFVTVSQLVASFGSIWTPAAASNTPQTIRALRKASVYAYPPPDPFPTVSQAGSPSAGHVGDVILSQFAAGLPFFHFQFTPS